MYASMHVCAFLVCLTCMRVDAEFCMCMLARKRLVKKDQNIVHEASVDCDNGRTDRQTAGQTRKIRQIHNHIGVTKPTYRRSAYAAQPHAYTYSHTQELTHGNGHAGQQQAQPHHPNKHHG
jgi:hypothetical protein